MFDSAVESSSMAFDVADSNIFYIDYARSQVDAVAGAVPSIGKVDFHLQRVGENIAFHVDILESAE